ncbi:hypothetical protein M1747_23575, partial [Salmonella enterica subsp. enterica serovar Oranienburg]
LVLPVSLVTPELQKVHPRGKSQLVTCEISVGSQPTRCMYIAMVGQVRPIGLLDPERNGLGDQRFELHVALSRHAVEQKG